MNRYPWVQLRRVAKTGTGHTPSRSRPELWIEEERRIPWITLADVARLRDGTLNAIFDTAECITPAGIASSSAVPHPAGTVVLSRTASVGFATILGRPMAVSQDFMTWTPGPRLHNRFLLHFLRGFRPMILGLMHGSTHKTIYMPDLHALKAPLPLLEVQHGITAFLDRECARIDELVAEVGATRRNLVEAERRGLDDLLPANAPRQRLGWLADVRSGVTVGQRYAPGQELVERPYLRVANVQADSLDLRVVKTVAVPTAEATATTLADGDVLMTEGGDIDKLGRGTVWRGEISGCLHQNHVFAVRPRTSRLMPEYLALVSRSGIARHYFESTATRSTNLASTNSSKVRAFRFPVPDVAMQRHICSTASTLFRSLGLARSQLAALELGLREYRDAIIVEAVTGRLDFPSLGESQLEESLASVCAGERPEVLAT